ncbi:hypothetical protein H4R20_005313, partial [Coemansia guatemalensis]
RWRREREAEAATLPGAQPHRRFQVPPEEEDVGAGARASCRGRNYAEQVAAHCRGAAKGGGFDPQEPAAGSSQLQLLCHPPVLARRVRSWTARRCCAALCPAAALADVAAALAHAPPGPQLCCRCRCCCRCICCCCCSAADAPAAELRPATPGSCALPPASILCRPVVHRVQQPCHLGGAIFGRWASLWRIRSWYAVRPL